MPQNERGGPLEPQAPPSLFARIRLCSRWLPLLVLALVALSAPQTRAQVRRITLKEMVERAATIVTGRVVEAREDHHPDYPHLPVTIVTLEVGEMLKGEPGGTGRHTFMQFGGVGRMRLMDLPTYRPGEEVVLFLYPISQYGLTSPIGGGQGKLYLSTDSSTGQRTVQGLLDTRLFEGVSDRMAIGRGGSIGYETFASIVRRLVKE